LALGQGKVCADVTRLLLTLAVLSLKAALSYQSFLKCALRAMGLGRVSTTK